MKSIMLMMSIFVSGCLIAGLDCPDDSQSCLIPTECQCYKCYCTNTADGASVKWRDHSKDSCLSARGTCDQACLPYGRTVAWAEVNSCQE